jgi:lipopolysaccharide export LptBFGC system permease protein LptF
MRRVGLLLSSYLLRTIAPYFFLSWILLSVILFVQQSGRFSDILFSINIPATLVWQLMIALVPNVIAFTCPMGILVGTVIGLAKMQGDSELVAMRAAGVGNVQITLPIIGLGILLSIFAFVVNLEGVPLAAQLVRVVAIKTAIQKLESPIEPGVFNTDLPGYTIFVKDGDPTTGRWENIFVYNEDMTRGSSRYITAREGRIDVSDQISELVLENAIVTTVPILGRQGKYVSENLGDLRIAIKTRRNEMIERLSSVQLTPEELGLAQLSRYASEREGRDRIEAQLLWQRRIILSITPLIFCIFGSAMILRTNRGGRGFGTILALLGLLVYYLLAFFGEQLARTGTVSVLIAGLIPIVVCLGMVMLLGFWKRLEVLQNAIDVVKSKFADVGHISRKLQFRNLLIDLTAGLRDLDLLTSLAKYFMLTLGFLCSISVVFTAFELWKFAGAMEGGLVLLLKYLFFLLPFIYLQYVAPTAALLAILATYVIKSRQNEVVTWTSAGLSIYRLLLPCFFATALLGFFNWEIQERILPVSNRIQDSLRTAIRSQGTVVRSDGRYWLYDQGKIITFQTPTSDNDNSVSVDNSAKIFASDNEKKLVNLTLLQLSPNEGNLQSLYRSNSATWHNGILSFDDHVEYDEVQERRVVQRDVPGVQLTIDSDPYLGVSEKPSHLTREQLKGWIDQSDSDTERRVFEVTLQKRYATPFLPLIIALFSAPFALSLTRQGRIATVGGAIAVWLLFIGVTNVFEQFGTNGSLTPELAIWAPLGIFAIAGVYLLSRVRT